MTLLASLIKNQGLVQLATATHATVATHAQSNQITVAEVATVAVAKLPKPLNDREKMQSIPTVSVQCTSCQYFKLHYHPHLGQCSEGERGAAGGFWDSDWRYCKSYLSSLIVEQNVKV